MSLRIHGLIWLVLALAVLLLSSLFVSSATYQNVLTGEIEGMVHWMGVEHSQQVVAEIRAQYKGIMTVLHIEEAKGWLETGLSHLPRRHGGKLLGVFDVPPETITRALEGPVYSVYLICWRIQNYLQWMGYVIPLLLALAFDGLMKRQVYAVNEHYWSPSHYNLVWHAMIVAASIAIMSLGVATTLPALLYPAVLVGLGFMARSLIVNLQMSA